MFWALVLCLFAFQENKAENFPHSSSLVVSPTPRVYSSIREVDFKNFTYLYPSNSSESFTLKNGIKKQNRKEDGASIKNLEYGDVTNDGVEEAMISIYPLMDGNCQCEMVFVYTLKNKKAKLLWSFDTWDRAEGGFKTVYAEKGNLAVEIFGDNRFENGEWKFNFPKDKFNGYCCPTAYTKIIFKWNGEKFLPAGKRQIFDYDWKKNQGK